MENKINIAKLLKDCPKGMELDCLLFKDTPVYFNRITDSFHYPIEIKVEYPDGSFEKFELSKEGCIYNRTIAKCVIFPKGKTTWEGFRPPFKDGDIIFGCYFDAICIFKDEGNIKGTIDYYCGISGSDELLIKDVKKQDEHFGYIDEYKLATEEEKAILFDAIKANGYKWNEETKNLEKLPKFKVGDKIQRMGYKVKITEVNIEDECYEYESIFAKGIGSISFSEQDNWKLVTDIEPKFKAGDVIQHKENSGRGCTIRKVEDKYYVEGHPTWCTIPFDKQDEYELVPSKFDITSLKPFESKVLVRDRNTDKWIGAFYSHCKSNGKKFYTIGSSYYYQCIPYEGNEHLLGTTDDCDEYFKNW